MAGTVLRLRENDLELPNVGEGESLEMYKEHHERRKQPVFWVQ